MKFLLTKKTNKNGSASVNGGGGVAGHCKGIIYMINGGGGVAGHCKGIIYMIN